VENKMNNLRNLYFHGNREVKKVALTFDDGPSDETEKILDILKKYHIRATFFVWGKRINGREKILRRIRDEGHEIGNHTYSHKRLWFKSKSYIEKDLKKCDEILKKFKIKTCLFRPPSFKIGFNLLNICKKEGKNIIACDVVTGDWKPGRVEKVVKETLRKTQNGSIIDLHDYIELDPLDKNAHLITEKIILGLKKKKYETATISELFNFS
jgi:peptidoglycan/xylan/chitin deacetylase (PgdA/CDA1 family)